MSILTENHVGGAHTKISKIQKLQRANQKLVQMGHKLHCYTFEPYTEVLFEKSKALKEKLTNLRQRNEEIISSGKTSNQVFENFNALVLNQLSDFDAFRNDFMEYSNILNQLHYRTS